MHHHFTLGKFLICFLLSLFAPHLMHIIHAPIDVQTVYEIQILSAIGGILVVVNSFYRKYKSWINKFWYAFFVRFILIVIYFPARWILYILEEGFNAKEYNATWKESFKTLK